MKKIFFLLLSAFFLLTACQTKSGKPFSVYPTSLDFEKSEGVKMLKVTAPDSWTLKQESGQDWCIPSVTSGDEESSVLITAKSNSSQARTAELVFSSPGSKPVTVTVRQAAGAGSEGQTGIYPVKASGLDLDPKLPDADKSCTIKFNPEPGNPLYNHKGELYAHLGVIDEGGDWLFVPSEWATTVEKVHFTKTGDNSWELKLTPSIREYFGSGETPVTKLGLIVRSADGNLKNHPDDQFCAVVDNLYKSEPFVPAAVSEKALPADVSQGINYNSDGSLTFVLYDKDTRGNRHEYCYIVGDWNDWERKDEGAMNWDGSAGCWWITLDGFEQEKEYRFQYRLGNSDGTSLYVSDPYTRIVYDQWNDQYIPGVQAFPQKARQLVSAFQIKRPGYDWQVSDFKIEDKHDLIIYELLLRDFTESQNLEGAFKELDYIQKLGVTAIELMPVQEFDGNLSWGYNPNHWFALDKYYGSREDYKRFIDECHKRGIAVIFDVVYNHATSLHAWTKMWWSANMTSDYNPFFNRTPAHAFNVFHDANHENPMFRDMVRRSLAFLLEEYKIDGFRFDLSKGFTQKRTDPDVAAWGRFDQSRINILKEYADCIWSVNSDALVILEHFADSDEEKVLAEYGMQLWRNMNNEYASAVSGGSGSFANVFPKQPFGAFVGYMESHDEERLCKGVSDAKLAITMRRAAASAAFFLLVPGPKMIWQFGEIGYDYPIDHNGRTGEKPVVTKKYLSIPPRKELYDTYSELLSFRKENPRFFDSDATFAWTPTGNVKKINCSADGRSFHLVGNFGKSSADYVLPAGDWTDYFSKAAVSGTISLAEGEFRLFVDF